MKNKTIIYIHGFGSNSFSKKAQILKKEFGKDIIIPTLPNIPKLAIETLKELIRSVARYGEVFLIGASLGGFYALHLQKIFKKINMKMKIVVINPAIKPHVRLQEALPKGINYYDNSFYDWKIEYLHELRNMKIGNYSNTLLLIQKGDEVLNYKEADKFLSNSKKFIEEGGNHSFINFEKYLKEINNFFFIKQTII